ncbi:MAG: cytochrome c biogenesis protein ResB, partial [Treponema sp.]|nr:cytochrome c biogenesis protein ResB [Treponema sp.]
ITLSKGREAVISQENTIVLDELEYKADANGRPQTWKSYVSVFRGEEKIIESYPIEVNHPLKVGGYSLYQYSYGVYADGSASGTEYTILRAVWDPGYAMVVLSLVIIGTGICITVFIKLTGQKS